MFSGLPVWLNSPANVARSSMLFFQIEPSVSLTKNNIMCAQKRERETRQCLALSDQCTTHTERRTRTRTRRERERQRREAGITKLMLALAATRPRRRWRGMCIYVTNLYKYVLWSKKSNPLGWKRKKERQRDQQTDRWEKVWEAVRHN